MKSFLMFWVRRINFLVNNLFTFYVGLGGRECSLFYFSFPWSLLRSEKPCGCENDGPREIDCVGVTSTWVTPRPKKKKNLSHAKHLTKIVHMKHIFILYICTQSLKLKLLTKENKIKNNSNQTNCYGSIPWRQWSTKD